MRKTKDGHNQRVMNTKISQLTKFLDRKKRLFPDRTEKPKEKPVQKEDVTNEGTYFTRTRSNKSRGNIMKKQLRPKIEPLMKDIGFKRGSYKMEPNSTANHLIITVKKSDLNKVKKALKPLGLPNIVQVVSEQKVVRPRKGRISPAQREIMKLYNYSRTLKPGSQERKNVLRIVNQKRKIIHPNKPPIEEDIPGNAVGQGGVDMAPNMGPRIKTIDVTDKRYRKDKTPVILKRFRTHVQEGSESWEAGYKRRVVKTTEPEHKEKGMNWRIKGKDKSHLTIKLYKNKPSQSEFNKQMRRVAGHEFGG